jgi:hypothetical protein
MTVSEREFAGIRRGFADSLPKDEQDACLYYSHQGDRILNSAHRYNLIGGEPDVKAINDNLIRAIGRYKMPKDTYVARGMSGKWANQVGEGLEVLPDARRGEHPAVADQHHALQTETLAQLRHLSGHGDGIAGVALEHLDRHRTALLVGQQAEDDLQVAGPLVAAVAVTGQRTLAALEVGRRQIVEHQRSFTQMLFGERLLDARLAGEQPVHGLVEIVFIGGVEFQNFAQAGAGGFEAEAAGGGQFGAGVEQAGEDQGDGQIAAAVGGAIEKFFQAQAA